MKKYILTLMFLSFSTQANDWVYIGKHNSGDIWGNLNNIPPASKSDKKFAKKPKLGWVGMYGYNGSWEMYLRIADCGSLRIGIKHAEIGGVPYPISNINMRYVAPGSLDEMVYNFICRRNATKK